MVRRGTSPEHGLTGRSRRPATAASRLALVQRVAEQLALAPGLEAIARVVASEVGPALGAAAVAVAMVNEREQTFEHLLVQGFSDEVTAYLREPRAVGEIAAAARALQDRQPVVYASRQQREALFPELAAVNPVTESAAVLPLVVHDRAIGLLTWAWTEARAFTRVDLALLRVVAHQCALAIDRARLDELRRAERETLELLSEGTRLMVSALDPEMVVDRLVHLAVPRLAPWCAVYVAENATVRRVAVGTAETAGGRRWATDLFGAETLDTHRAGPVGEVLRSGRTLVIPSVGPETLAGMYGPEQAARLAAEAARWTGLVVPIMVGGRTIGAMSMASPEWRRSPPDQVLFAVEGLAARAGVALANARRFEQQRSTASQLVAAVLPVAIPDIPGFETAARYLPAAGGRVGGDWFDVMELPTGDWLVGIGDAGGHGIPAAALMAQLRNAARGLAIGGAGPADILSGLHQLTAMDSDDSFATATYGLLQPGLSVMRWASAGQVPPLALGARRCRYVDDPAGPPLGAPAPGGRPPEHSAYWEPGQGVVLVTDGAVERRRAGIDAGMARLRSFVARRSTLPAPALARAIAEGICTGAEDDCTVVVLRRH